MTEHLRAFEWAPVRGVWRRELALYRRYWTSSSFAALIEPTIFLLAFVLPRFTVIYASKGAALPLPTQILMTASNVVVGHWIALLLSLIGVFAAGWFFLLIVILILVLE